MYFNKDIKLNDIIKDITKTEGSKSKPYESFSYYKEEYLDRYIAYKEKKNYGDELTVIYVNIGLDKEFYDKEIVKTINNPSDPLVLVNKYNQIPSDYNPVLSQLDTTYATTVLKVTPETKTAFINLCDAAAKKNLQIKAVSTYRTYDYQKKLYDRYIKSDGVDAAETYSARAGFSEHHTGLAIDVQGGDTVYTQFGTTKEYSWLKDHAHEYGFIIRYAKNKKFITGYMAEEWHIRYLGIDVASYIYEHDITFDEYSVKYLAN